jgi:hypothetical protein
VIDGPLQSIIDRLVEAVGNNDQRRLREFGRALQNQHAVLTGDWIDGGVFVTNEEVEEAFKSFVEASSHLDEERVAALLDGAPVYLHDFREFCSEAAASNLFEDPDAPVWHISKVRASKGANAYVVGWVFGSSREGLDQIFLGVARTETEARALAQRVCYTDLADVATRYPAPLESIAKDTAATAEEDFNPLAQDRKRFVRKRALEAFVTWKRNERRSQQRLTGRPDDKGSTPKE